MKMTIWAVTVIVMLGGMAWSAGADPAPPFGSTVADASSYDITVTLLPDNEYQWLVDYNDSVLPNPEYMKSFVVYDSSVSLISWTDPTGWVGFADGGAAAVEWSASPATNRISPGDSLVYQAKFDTALADPLLTAIHIQYPDGSQWTNNTPELPPVALLSLSMLPLGLAYIRGRWRKES